MATNYQRGYNLERRAIRRLEADGWTCIRAAGSHGPFDVVAWQVGCVRFIQVKGGGWPGLAELERMALTEIPHNGTREVWRYDKRKRKPRIKVWRRDLGEWREV